MLDINFIREHKDRVVEGTAQKGYTADIDHLFKIDEQRRTAITEVESLRQKKNEVAASMKGGKPNSEQVEKGRALKVQVAEQEARLAEIESDWMTLLKQVPNMPHHDVPVGASEDENVVVKEVGEKPTFDFVPKNHWQIAEAKGFIDKERATKVSGARFAYLKGDLVLLWEALKSFATAQLTNQSVIATLIEQHNLQLDAKPFIPVHPPYLIKTDVYDAMDRLEPQEDRYKIEGEELWLQGSAEHVLGSMHTEEIFEETELPVRYLGFATSFRKEAGTYGKDMEGIIRLHQFDKLEMESLTTAETSFDEHLLMIAIQEYLMQQLALPYRVVMKCTADIGKPNARGVDIDVWLPGQGQYRETHTADYMTDYQARRLKTRYKNKAGEINLVHTNDATAFSQRPLIAIIENYQNEDGSVRVPDVLKPYLGGREILFD